MALARNQVQNASVSANVVSDSVRQASVESQADSSSGSQSDSHSPPWRTWSVVVVMDPGITAALAAGFAEYVVVLWPASRGAERWLAIAVIWTLAALSMAGLRLGARVLSMITLVKVAAFVAVIIVAFGAGRGSWSHYEPFVARHDTGIPMGEAIALGLVSVFFSFGGFWEASRMAGEVRDAPRIMTKGEHSCTRLRSEAVDGQPAELYRVQSKTATGGSDTQIWISTATGLPLRQTVAMAAAGIGFWQGESPGPNNGVPESDTLAAVKLAWELAGRPDVNATAHFNNVPIEGNGIELLHRLPLNVNEFDESAPGDMRWGGSSAVHGAAVRGVNSVVQFLVDNGGDLQAKNRLGWTPLMLTEGMYIGQTEKEQPATAAFIRELLGSPTGRVASAGGGRP